MEKAGTEAKPSGVLIVPVDSTTFVLQTEWTLFWCTCCYLHNRSCVCNGAVLFCNSLLSESLFITKLVLGNWARSILYSFRPL